jgi:hypothetical protein
MSVSTDPEASGGATATTAEPPFFLLWTPRPDPVILLDRAGA